ncbi:MULTISPECIES: hypothetical protein [unclassified Leifsonia]|uniref:hypothetical protein n=1 Tax=unclassified Leifsonia TaxID=2663824 RepID=UPI0006F4CE15|nr:MULTISPECIES: hypothetical protein [unclassified Leifsonia]KQX08014.1 hypothetical protein ASC59_10000 [Leifsonia sp. Root1293]KRA12295.1 hypothetical protein ASD61_10000 [Leifsonia sp. Root60]
MSTLKHPVGPQSSKVYWRRRLVVGLGLIAVIVAIILIVVRPGSSSGQPNDQKAPQAVSTSSEKPAADATAIPTDAVDAKGVACKDDDLVVKAVTDLEAYAADQKPQLTLSLTNTGSKPCVVNAGSSQQVFTITSGDEVYWLSTDCQKDAVDAEVTLKPNVPIGSAAPLTWDRTRSSADSCDGDREVVPAGGASYKLTVTLGNVTSEPTQFLLD